jgi:hypothetical protein
MSSNCLSIYQILNWSLLKQKTKKGVKYWAQKAIDKDLTQLLIQLPSNDQISYTGSRT